MKETFWKGKHQENEIFWAPSSYKLISRNFNVNIQMFE